MSLVPPARAIFTNARLIFPDGVRDNFEIVVENGAIAEVRSARAGDRDAFDLRVNYIAPGFVDLHIHGALGRDTMEASPEAFRAIRDYHASGGTTSLLLTTATAPMAEIQNALRAIEQHAATIPQIVGAHVEGPFISPAKPGAQRAEFIREPSIDLTRQLFETAAAIKLVTLAPELPGALELIDALRGRGIRVSGGHSDGWDEDARAAFEGGMRHVTHTFNCMSTARRRGIERVAGLLEFAMSEPEILCELIADGHHVSPTLMKMLYRAKGAAGICLVTDATAGAGLPIGSRFSLAGRECVVDEGVCLLADRSALAGSSARMIDLVRNMVQLVGVPLHEAVGMATDNPARAIGLGGKKGSLEPGADADFVVINPQLEVVTTFHRGEQIFPARSRAET
jgi:N-acetylglucosamine-6-phosphate deacetylase